MTWEPINAEDQSLVDKIKDKAEQENSLSWQSRLTGQKRSPESTRRQLLRWSQRWRGSTIHMIPAPPDEVKFVETAVGLVLPPLMREIFVQVGNGGFGPGYGITGLETGTKLFGSTFTENVMLLRSMKSHLADLVDETQRQAQSDLDYPESLPNRIRDYIKWHSEDTYVVYCDWGGTVSTIVDIGEPSLPVFSNEWASITPHSSGTLRQWWRDWLDGTIQQD